MSIIERYHTFLHEQDIRVIEELTDELISSPYNIEITFDHCYDDLVLLNVTEDTDTSIEITNIFNGLIINKHNIKIKVNFNMKKITNKTYFTLKLLIMSGKVQCNKFRCNEYYCTENFHFSIFTENNVIRLFYTFL